MALKVGVIGCGNISKFHLEGYKAAGADIVCVSDLNEDLAKSKARIYNCDYTTDYKELLARDEIRSVSVCLPNYLHYQVSVDVLEAGKIVLCEKPMTTKVEDSEKLVAKVKETGGKFQIGYMKRFHPAFKLFKELAPEIGKIESGMVRVYHPLPKEAWERQGRIPTWFVQKEKSGGGPLVHSGSHMLDIMRWVAGDPIRVDARIKFKPGFDIDYLTNAILDLESGATLFLEVGWLSLLGVGFRQDGWDEFIELRGDKGRIVIYSTWWDDPEHQIPVVELYREADKSTQRFAPGKFNYFTEEIKSFVKTAEEDGVHKPDVVDGYKVEAIIDALYKSAEKMAPEEVVYKYKY